jgi:hypothetical protein
MINFPPRGFDHLTDHLSSCGDTISDESPLVSDDHPRPLGLSLWMGIRSPRRKWPAAFGFRGRARGTPTHIGEKTPAVFCAKHPRGRSGKRRRASFPPPASSSEDEGRGRLAKKRFPIAGGHAQVALPKGIDRTTSASIMIDASGLLGLRRLLKGAFLGGAPVPCDVPRASAGAGCGGEGGQGRCQDGEGKGGPRPHDAAEAAPGGGTEMLQCTLDMRPGCRVAASRSPW